MHHAFNKYLPRTNLKICIGGGLTSITVLMAVVYVFWQPWDIAAVDVAKKLQGFSWQHWLGTDVYGRDILLLVMGGGFSALRVAVLAILIGLLGGGILGFLAAVKKGWWDDVFMRLSDFMFAFPAILIAILLVATLKPSTSNAVIAIGLANVPIFARLTRNGVNSILSKDFIRSAQALGQGHVRIMWHHVLPNLLPLLIVQGTIQLSLAVLGEATLTYLNLGTQAPSPSWGRMLYEAQTLFFTNPMLAIIPGFFLALTIFGLNQLGDGLRDMLILKR